jgi:hypothetical protein
LLRFWFWASSLEALYAFNPVEHDFTLIELNFKHSFHIRCVGFANKGSVSKVSLLLGFFFSKDMALESMLSFYFACPGNFKPFLSP